MSTDLLNQLLSLPDPVPEIGYWVLIGYLLHLGVRLKIAEYAFKAKCLDAKKRRRKR